MVSSSLANSGPVKCHQEKIGSAAGQKAGSLGAISRGSGMMVGDGSRSGDEWDSVSGSERESGDWGGSAPG